MNKLNLLTCSVTGGNVGRGDCDIEKGPLVGHIAIPRDHEFAYAATDTATAFETALIAGAIADDYNSRFMPIYSYQEITPAGDDVQEETLASGLIRRLRDGKVAYDFLLTEGMNVHRSLKASIDGRHAQYDVLEVTKQDGGKFGVWGTKAQDTSLNNVMAGYRLERLNVNKYTGNVYSAGSRFTLSMGYADNDEVEKNWAVMILDRNPLEQMAGLMSVILTTVTSPTATTIHTKLITTWGKDLIDDYAAAFAQAGAWKVVNRKIGSADFGDEITVASVAATATGWTITIAATGVDSDNPGTGENVGISLRAPSVLAALTTPIVGLEGYEEVTVELA